jgi:hypothetical protein
MTNESLNVSPVRRARAAATGRTMTTADVLKVSSRCSWASQKEPVPSIYTNSLCNVIKPVRDVRPGSHSQPFRNPFQRHHRLPAQTPRNSHLLHVPPTLLQILLRPP